MIDTHVATFKFFISLVVGAFISFLGGWSNMLQTMLILLGIDFVLGFFWACKRGEVSPHIMFLGALKKFTVLMIVGMCFLLDRDIFHTNGLVYMGVITYFIITDAISIIRNAKGIGIFVPKFLTDILLVEQKKIDMVKEGENNGA